MVLSAIDAQAVAITALADAGDWLTADERVDAWRHVRAAADDPLDRARKESLSPFSMAGLHNASATLSSAAVEVVHRVATDPGRLTRSWADAQIAALGEEVYTELVGITAIASVVDRFHDSIGEPVPDIPSPGSGEPARQRPDDVGDVGAWVAQTVGPARANVSRTLSLVPVTNATWRVLVDSHYSRGADFMDAVWERPLSRPQVELVASRTTALNECFY